METLYSIALGIGLSAACGLRVFVPFLVMSGAALSGHLDLSADFAWVGTYPALAAFITATVVEIAGYYVPWLDNVLDTVATPLALAAGTLASAAVLDDVSPLVQWTLAAVSGGGVAGLIQIGTVLLRAASSAATGGLGNLFVATGESTISFATAVLAIAAPLAAVTAVAVLCTFAIRRIVRWRKQRRYGASPDDGAA